MNTKKWTRTIWIFLCLLVLLWAWLNCRAEVNQALRGECIIIAVAFMVLLTMPLGLVWVCLLSGSGLLLSKIGIEIEDSPFFNLIIWLGFLLWGYIQWFIILPKIVHKFKKKDNSSEPTT